MTAPVYDATYWESRFRRLAEVYNQQSRKLAAQQRRADRMESRAAKAERHLRHFEYAHVPPVPGEPDPVDDAWFSVWLHGNWRFLTSKMTTEQREAAAAAVLRADAIKTAADEDDPDPPGPPTGLRWWSEGQP